MGLTQWETLCGLFFCFFEKIVVPILTSGGADGTFHRDLISHGNADFRSTLLNVVKKFREFPENAVVYIIHGLLLYAAASTIL